MWKSAVAILALLALSEAADWQNVKPAYRVKPTVLKKTYRHTNRIVGGTFATVGQFPYVSAILIDGTSFCGGVLISDYTVLTAAHCVNGGSTFEITLGALNIYDETEPGRLKIVPAKVRVHEAYSDFNLANDVAILEFPSRIEFTDTIKPIRLPSWSQKDLLFDEELPARIAGWGWTYDGENSISSDLLYADVTTLYTELCESYYGLLYHSSQLCIDTFFGQYGTCDGDAGGPLILVENDGNETLIGIASYYADDGCEGIGPQGFARISSQLDWLEVHGGVIIRP
ncbi:brachyurin-like [Cloeon dipterum]|uniref:brachyurin-like n=1 Tax=Cloeon dipterum TaxID=197152 RepID=UPI0032209F06